MELSDKEKELYDFIKGTGGASVKQIEGNLSPKHVGGLGRLVRQALVKKEKRKDPNAQYAVKAVAYYIINSEGDN